MNLWKYPDDLPKTVNNVTFTRNGDAVLITVNGKATADTSIGTTVHLDAGDYLLHGIDGWTGAALILQNGAIKAKGTKEGQSVTLTEGDYTLQIRYGVGLSTATTTTPALYKLD